jgi:hypothetical protein
MFFTNRDIGRFVFIDHINLFAAGDLGGARDDDPVFGAVIVLLQAKARAGVNDDALNLKTIISIDTVVGTPRAINLTMA